MALQSTSHRGEQHVLGKGGERRQEQQRKAGGGGTGTGTAKGEADVNGEGSGGRGQKGVRWWRMCRSTGIPTRGTVPIRFGTYNIHNGRNGGLESALRGMSQANTDLDIFQEKKVTDGIYTRGLAGYSVVAADAPSRHHGRVEVFHRPAPHFAVEAVQQFGPNVVSLYPATREKWWYIKRCYLAPDDTLTTESVVAKLKERPRGAEILVAGDFNVNLSEPEGDRRGEDIAAAMATEGLEDMSEHLLPRRRSWCRDRRTWSMIREVRSQTDYILGTDLCLFGNVSVRDPMHNSDHYMVMGFLHSAPLKEHARYLGGRKRPPLCPPTATTREERIFAALKRAVTKLLAREARKNAWISAATWRLVDERVSARQYLAKEQALIRRLGRTIKASLQEDIKRRAEEAEEELETLMESDPPLHREAWQRIKGWYKAVVDRSPPPAQVTLERITV